MNFSKLKFTSICLLLGVVLLSCVSDDYKWSEAQLKIEQNVVSDSRGRFEIDYTRDSHTSISNGSGWFFRKIKEIEYTDGTLEINADGAYTKALIQLLEDEEVVSEYKIADGHEGINRYDDDALRRFQKDMLEYLELDEEVDLRFSAESNFEGKTLKIGMYMDVKVLATD